MVAAKPRHWQERGLVLRQPWPARIAARQFLLAASAGLVTSASARWVDGSVSLGPKQAKVVTKFCFDFNPACKPDCPDGEHPGEVDILIKAPGDISRSDQDSPRLHVALLDDEYFSFPEVSQVWDQLSCEEVLKAAKRSFPVSWAEAQRPEGTKVWTRVSEKLRPRWWYVAFVSCSGYPLQVEYKGHFTNRLRRSGNELSMDEPGVQELLFLTVVFGLVAWLQRDSVQRWRVEAGGGPESALWVLTLTAYIAVASSFAWLLYYWGCTSSGQGSFLWLLIGRGGVTAAKTIMQVILLLLAQGECVATPGITWSKHWELVGGNSAFGALSFLLELYGDSQFQSTNTEYIYDTRPGTALLAFDVFWMWMYASRSWATFQRETRSKGRRFYKHYAPFFGMWFASLPMIAAIAAFISPWYRLYVVFLLSSLVHAVALGTLVLIFSPDFAPGLFECSGGSLVKSRKENSNAAELERMVDYTDL